MIGPAAIVLFAAAQAPSAEIKQCAAEVGASAIVTRLADLPQDIRDEMKRLPPIFGPTIADSDAVLLDTDAPGPADRHKVQVKFSQALRVGDQWYVQFEVAMLSGVHTAGFHRQADGRFYFSPWHYFSGPPCASIKAALAGVTTLRRF